MSNLSKANCVAVIFARGGSKGVPRKNIRLFGDKPLIAHSIQIANECPSITRVVVSTDDNEIAEIASKYGADVPFIRPKELAQDRSNEYDAWKHAINELEKTNKEKIDVFVSLPPTSPLRSVADVESCIHEFLDTEANTVIAVKEASRSPFFNMISNNEEGFAQLVCAPSGSPQYYRRQDVPAVYDMTTVAYVSSPDFILSSNSIFDGTVRSVLIPDERAIDIDTLLDFKFAELLLAEREQF